MAFPGGRASPAVVDSDASILPLRLSERGGHDPERSLLTPGRPTVLEERPHPPPTDEWDRFPRLREIKRRSVIELRLAERAIIYLQRARRGSKSCERRFPGGEDGRLHLEVVAGRLLDRLPAQRGTP